MKGRCGVFFIRRTWSYVLWPLTDRRSSIVQLRSQERDIAELVSDLGPRKAL